MSDPLPRFEPSVAPHDWLEVPEYFPIDEENTLALIRKFKADGLAVRIQSVIIGLARLGHSERWIFHVHHSDAPRVAAILDILLFSGSRQGETPTHCEACGADAGRAERCPSCGLNRRQDLEGDLLAAWIEKHIGGA